MNKQRIIEEAAKLFIMRGIKATTMDDIAKYLSISKRTIYEHFKDKNELLRFVVDNASEKMLEEEEIIYNNADNVLEALLEILRLRKTSFNIKKMKTGLEVKRYYPDIFDKKLRENEGLTKLEKTFEEGIEQGVFRQDLNPKTSAFLFSEQSRMLFSEQMEKIDYETLSNFDISFLQVVEDLFLNFLRGVSTPLGIEIIEKYISEK